MRRVGLRFRGTVQGVGFRPYLRRLADEHDLTGVVLNDGDGVWCEVQGGSAAVDRFVAGVARFPPPLARIREWSAADLAPAEAETGFVIGPSGAGSGRAVVSVPPDVAPCAACRAELFDPVDRRHRYAFLCCTDCGPRFTVIQGLPYDRERTSMAPFTLCDRCRSEYEDPDDRRFHAQATCCGDCGPRLWMRSSEGRLIDAADPVAAVVDALTDGRIVAVKGLGGYQLLCRADDGEVVARLRRRKRREEKPFALLCRDLAQVEAIVQLSELERRALADPAAPIVLARRRAQRGGELRVAPLVAPDTELLGVMLPSSPVHLLISDGFGAPLVCTSGNVSDEPIVVDDERVVSELGSVADVILGHDRVIERRADDSIGRVVNDDFQVLRRARGFAARPIRLPDGLGDGPVVLAVGAQLKNTVGMVADRDAQLSVHLGDLDHPLAVRAFEQTVADLIGLVGVAPDVVVHDLHPEYLSSKFALAADLAPTLGVQHHHAHLASCLVDNHSTAGAVGGADTDRRGPVLGVTFDGLGWGPDGTLWGGEFLVGDVAGFKRFAHLRPVLMPGGEAAIHEPWRMAVAHLIAAGLDVEPTRIERGLAVDAVVELVEQGRGPTTTSMGRLFDAVAALCGVTAGRRTSYEGQAAIGSEQLATTAIRRSATTATTADHGRSYTVALTSSLDGSRDISLNDGAEPDEQPPMQIDPGPMLAEVIEDLGSGTDPAVVAFRFHRWVADVIRSIAGNRQHHGCTTVALTGGVFQNRLLTELTYHSLTVDGFTVLTHRRVPPNDGGIALGQLAIARAAGTGDAQEGA